MSMHVTDLKKKKLGASRLCRNTMCYTPLNPPSKLFLQFSSTHWEILGAHSSCNMAILPAPVRVSTVRFQVISSLRLGNPPHPTSYRSLGSNAFEVSGNPKRSSGELTLSKLRSGSREPKNRKSGVLRCPIPRSSIS